MEIKFATPELGRFFLSALQDSDAFKRADVERTFSHDLPTRDQKLAEIDAERERNAPIVGAYLLTLATVAILIAFIAVLWRSVSG